MVSDLDRCVHAAQVQAQVLHQWKLWAIYHKCLQQRLSDALGKRQHRSLHTGMAALWWNAHLEKGSRSAAMLWFRKMAVAGLAALWYEGLPAVMFWRTGVASFCTSVVLVALKMCQPVAG